jgi:hypothetical protein
LVARGEIQLSSKDPAAAVAKHTAAGPLINTGGVMDSRKMQAVSAVGDNTFAIALGENGLIRGKGAQKGPRSYRCSACDRTHDLFVGTIYQCPCGAHNKVPVTEQAN